MRPFEEFLTTSSPWRNSGCIRAAMHPGWLRCSSLTYAQYARSSRLASRAPRRSRCDAGFHLGLLGAVAP